MVISGGLEFVAEIGPARYCDRTIITLKPLKSNVAFTSDGGDVTGSLGFWVFLHAFVDEAFDKPCSASSVEGLSRCNISSRPLQFQYDAKANLFTAVFVAEWAMKYYQLSVEVKSNH